MTVYALKVPQPLTATQLDLLLLAWHQVMGEVPVTIEQVDSLPVVDGASWAKGSWPWPPDAGTVQ